MPRSDPSGQTVLLDTVHSPGLHRCQTGPPALDSLGLDLLDVPEELRNITQGLIHGRFSASGVCAFVALGQESVYGFHLGSGDEMNIATDFYELVVSDVISEFLK